VQHPTRKRENPSAGPGDGTRCRFGASCEGGADLKVLTHFRNACAHNERFFLLKSPKADIPDLSHHGRLEIPKKGDTYACGKRDLFAVVIALRCMLSVDRFQVFQKQLEHEIDGYLQDSGALTSEQLYEGMGFPPRWREI